MLRAMGVSGVPSSTWAAKPAATALPVGAEILVTDIGPLGTKFYTTGTEWVPVGGRIRLSRVCADATESTNSTSEIKTYGILVPAGLLAVGCEIQVAHEWTYPNSANMKTFRVRFGTADDLTGTVMAAPTFTTTATNQLLHNFRITDGSMAAQTGMATSVSLCYTNSSSAPATAAINARNNTYIVISSQRTLGTEAVVNKAYSVDIFW